jgi:O-antigen/teichoic acid export membrane protein
MTTLHQKTTSAVLWSMLDVFVRQGLQVIVVMVLARILTPETFGLFAMLALFIGVADAFIDSGFSSALIQRQNTTHTDESTVFFFNVGMGTAAALLLCAAAPSIAAFFKQPVLQYVTYVVALDLSVGGLGAVHKTLLAKELDFKTTAKVGLVASLTSGALAIILASQGLGVWSLAGQMLAITVITVILLWTWHPWRPLWVFSFASLRTLFRFGGYLTAVGVVSALHTSLYSVLIGKFYSVRDVGIYDRAQRAQATSGNLIMAVINRVAYPVFSATAHDKERLARGFRKGQRLVMFVNIPLMLTIIVLADPIVRSLFGNQWLASVPVLRVLGAVGLMLPMQIFNLNVLMAQGRSDLMFNIMLLKRTVAIGLTVAASFYGIMAIAWAQVLASIFSLWANAHYTDEFLDYGVFKQFRDLLPYAVASIPAGLVMWAVSSLSDWPPYLKLVLGAGTGAGLYLLASHLLRVDAHTEIIRLLRSRSKAKFAAAEL